MRTCTNKNCIHQGAPQPLDNFHKNTKKKSGYQQYCKPCQAKHQKDNRQDYAASTKRAREKTVANKQKWIASYLEIHHCPCGESRRCCLQFDHIDPSIKTDDIGRLVRSGCSLQTLKVEIEKTRVLCANCHCVRTSLQFGWYKKRAA